MPKWHIVKQELTTDLPEGSSGFVRVWEVTYRIDDGPAAGTQGMVRIPVEQFNADTVRATVEAMIAHNHAVGGLGNG